MRDWSLQSSDPLCLTIAADARLCTPNYVDDQIWELHLEGGEPPSLAIETSYGLRARAMRVFPGFGLGGAVLSDPVHFHSPPRLRRFYPNFLRVSFEPFPDLRVIAEYWVPESHLLVGRLVLRNLSERTLHPGVRLYAVLSSSTSGERMIDRQQGGITRLEGSAANLEPVVFLAGGAQIAQTVHPALAKKLSLGPGEERSVVWSHAGLAKGEDSFEAAREAAAMPIDANIARLELTNQALLEISTGNVEWDAVLAFAQKTVLGGYLGPTDHLPNPSFVLSRWPDQGYSSQGDGRDYSWRWEGQPAFEAYQHFSQLTLAAPELARGLLDNFLHVQLPDGEIDWKPGLGGQRNGALCAPLLAAMAWELYTRLPDDDWLSAIFPGLMDFVGAWFSQEHDRDLDGVPEWDHSAQTGMVDNPSFVRWMPWGQALDISKAETPDLASYLLRECEALLRMAERLGQEQAADQLQSPKRALERHLDQSWSDQAALYPHVDRDTHVSTVGSLLGRGRGAFALEIEQGFDPPARLLFRCRGAEELSRAAQAFIHGRGTKGRHRVEKVSGRQFQWFWEFGSATSEHTYREVERIELRGLSEQFETEVLVADYSRVDVGSFFPLWAGVPDRARAEALVRGALMDRDRFWRPFGVPAVCAEDPVYRQAVEQGDGGVHLGWVRIVLEGLLRYGFRSEAGELMTRLLEANVAVLKEDHAFRAGHHPDTGEGLGERGHVAGAPPVDLFVELLGLRLLSPWKLVVTGPNVFGAPATVRWRGLEARVGLDQIEVRFPNGQRTALVPDRPQLVEARRT
jgi:hypothetical protein